MTTNSIGVIDVIRFKLGRTKGVLFKQKRLSDRGVKWNDLIAYNDGSRTGNIN